MVNFVCRGGSHRIYLDNLRYVRYGNGLNPKNTRLNDLLHCHVARRNPEPLLEDPTEVGGILEAEGVGDIGDGEG